MGKCSDCAHWTQTEVDGNGNERPIYSEWALVRHPEWYFHGLCKHPQSKIHPLWEGAEAVATEADFGCVQFERK